MKLVCLCPGGGGNISIHKAVSRQILMHLNSLKSMDLSLANSALDRMATFFVPKS